MGYVLSQAYAREARVFFCSCNIRYETFKFYNSTNLLKLKFPPQASTPLRPASPAINPKGRRNNKWKFFIIILLPLVASLALLAFLFRCCYVRRGKAKQALKKAEAGEEIRTPESLQMDLATIKAATGNFSHANKLGRGGFGTVYKGTLHNGQSIAVKRLSQNSIQGEKEFRNEALLVARLQHRNLVRFLGFCLEDKERLLIYELLHNKSLDYFLFDPIKRMYLDWQTRYKIIGGIARGLLYLHEDSRLLVVHRDLKASNILLDVEMNPKISDFGMAKLFGVDQTQGNTHKICGTYGYMPPEYVQHGHFSIKSDVFSFGVLLLEIISGQRVSSFDKSENGQNLLGFVWKNWLERSALNVVDPSMSTFDTMEALRCINIGLLCVQEEIAHRPIMSSIVLMLNSDTISPPTPSRPAYLLNVDVELDHSSNTSPLQHNDQVTDESMNEISMSELDPR